MSFCFKIRKILSLKLSNYFTPKNKYNRERRNKIKLGKNTTINYFNLSIFYLFCYIMRENLIFKTNYSKMALEEAAKIY